MYPQLPKYIPSHPMAIVQLMLLTYPPVRGDPYIMVKRYNRRSYSPK
jgi:hypothetical protein